MSKKISTFQVILLAVFGAVGVGAVLIFALATAGGGGGGVSPVTIWGTFDANAVKEVLRAAANQDSRLSQVTYVQKDPTTFEADLANALSSGTGPDIFILSGNEALYDENKVYAIPYSALSQSQFQSTFVGAADLYLSQNGVIGLPILVDPLVLYWDRDSLSNAGIAQPPAYWDQVPYMAQSLTQKDQSGLLQKSAIALGTYQNIGAAKDILSMLIEQAGGQITMQNSAGQYVAGLSQGGATSKGAQSALQFYTEFANPSQSDYSWNNAQGDARQSFAGAELAMYVGYASEESLIRAANPNLNFAAAPVPQLRSEQNSIDAGAVYALAIPKASPNLQSALTVAYLIASAPVDQALASVLGIAPARRDALALGAPTTTAQTIDASLFYKMALIVRTWADPNPSETDPVFQDMIEGTESGAVQITDAIGRANQQIENLLNQAQPASQ
jgi:maltose-binding protein MalE